MSANSSTDSRADELLAIRCQLGERDAFDSLIARWHEPLWRYLRRLGGSDDAAGDLTQDTWMRVLRGIASLRDPANLRPWLFGIARRVAMDRLRHQYRQDADRDAVLEDLPAPAADTDLVADLAALEAGVELSLKARLGYVALLLVSAAMTTVVASLWLTEAALPLRTQLAFGAVCAIGVSWITLAFWALRARRPLFARDRVIAGRMAVTFTSVFAAAGIVAVTIAGNVASFGVLAMGVTMLAAAVRVLLGARLRHAELLERRSVLETG